ncbi:MAG: hypothetical protein LBU42_03165 [Prevotellaceae bacterium]|jgi:phage terminase Nu1 subunit (DNA packaging protein)|nr:hypothetical protein [Prevotellaceae bacterium]
MKSKKIPKGWVKLSEFERMSGLSSRTVALAIAHNKIPAECVKKIGAGATSPKYVDPQAAAVSWYQNLNAGHHLSRTLRSTLAKYIKKFAPDVVGEDIKKSKEEARSKMSFDESLRREKAAKAETAEIELEEKKGSLISKVNVYNSLFEAGQQIRDALLSIPERITDEIIAVVESRTKVRNLIHDAIAAELEKLSEINKKYE